MSCSMRCMTASEFQLADDERFKRLWETVGLWHAAAKCALHGGMSQEAIAQLNERLAELCRDSLELLRLKQKPNPAKRLVPSDRDRQILLCALEFLSAGKMAWGLAGRVKRKLRSRLSVRQINRVLDQWMPGLLNFGSQK